MTNFITGLIGIAGVCTFLGIMLWWIKAVPLIIICVLVMALLVAASQFGIQPLMAQLKADALPREVMQSVLRDRFAAWHGVSSILYLVQSLLGLWLVVWANRGLK